MTALQRLQAAFVVKSPTQLKPFPTPLTWSTTILYPYWPNLHSLNMTSLLLL